MNKKYTVSLTGNVLRCQAALAGLKDLIAARGVAGTVALFKKSGRAGLEKSLRVCAGSWEPSIQQSPAKGLSNFRTSNGKVTLDAIVSVQDGRSSGTSRSPTRSGPASRNMGPTP